MQIHSPLLLLVTFAFVYAPSLGRWLDTGSNLWYRHHLVWLAIILFVFFSLRQQRRNDL
ncbi:hypothetical protein AB4876_15315 [Zhongshania guokunii]|uniref:Uncharacterized protein n=1 Tax=Zhongshania guokunii TaxID=641783 RepID=A0ABV3U9T4_9GAMM